MGMYEYHTHLIVLEGPLDLLTINENIFPLFLNKPIWRPLMYNDYALNSLNFRDKFSLRLTGKSNSSYIHIKLNITFPGSEYYGEYSSHTDSECL